MFNPIPKKNPWSCQNKKISKTRMEATDKQNALDGVKVLWNNMFQADLSII